MRTTFSRRESFQAVLAACIVPLFGWRQGRRPHQEDTNGNQNSPAASPGAVHPFPATSYLYDDCGRLVSVIGPEPHDGTSRTY